jgi:hypothetical protein
MEHTASTSSDELALAEAMVRLWGQQAALKASDNACTQAFIGNQAAARKWHRVMLLIAAVAKDEASCDEARDCDSAPAWR